MIRQIIKAAMPNLNLEAEHEPTAESYLSQIGNDLQALRELIQMAC